MSGNSYSEQPTHYDNMKRFVDGVNAERKLLDKNMVLTRELIDRVLEKAFVENTIFGKEPKANVLQQAPYKASCKVHLPVRDYPTINFKAKILGLNGDNLQRLEVQTNCRIVLKGRRSMRDKAYEEQLRQSGDPKYAHLKQDLFVEISSLAPPADSFANVSYALQQIRDLIDPHVDPVLFRKPINGPPMPFRVPQNVAHNTAPIPLPKIYNVPFHALSGPVAPPFIPAPINPLTWENPGYTTAVKPEERYNAYNRSPGEDDDLVFLPSEKYGNTGNFGHSEPPNARNFSKTHKNDLRYHPFGRKNQPQNNGDLGDN